MRLAALSSEGDPEEALCRSNPSKGGRPGFDMVLKFKMLVLQSLHSLSLFQTSYMVRDRLSWMRFCGLGPGDRVPDANTLWDFREALIEAKAQDKAFERLDAAIMAAGYLPMGGQIVDATLFDIAIPVFGYKNHVSVDRNHSIIRREKASDASAHDGARLREGLIDPNNRASDIWADSAYRSQANEEYLEVAGKKSRIHHKKPKGRSMPKPLAKGNRSKSKIRAKVEHIFAEQKSRMGLTKPDGEVRI